MDATEALAYILLAGLCIRAARRLTDAPPPGVTPCAPPLGQPARGNRATGSGIPHPERIRLERLT